MPTRDDDDAARYAWQRDAWDEREDGGPDPVLVGLADGYVEAMDEYAGRSEAAAEAADAHPPDHSALVNATLATAAASAALARCMAAALIVERRPDIAEAADIRTQLDAAGLTDQPEAATSPAMTEAEDTWLEEQGITTQLGRAGCLADLRYIDELGRRLAQMPTPAAGGWSTSETLAARYIGAINQLRFDVATWWRHREATL